MDCIDLSRIQSFGFVSHGSDHDSTQKKSLTNLELGSLLVRLTMVFVTSEE